MIAYLLRDAFGSILTQIVTVILMDKIMATVMEGLTTRLVKVLVSNSSLLKQMFARIISKFVMQLIR
mgnify:CR=1 FL=1